MFDTLFLSLSSLIIPPAVSPMTQEIRYHIVVPASIQEAFCTDWNNLHNDWLIVGQDLSHATAKTLTDVTKQHD